MQFLPLLIVQSIEVIKIVQVVKPELLSFQITPGTRCLDVPFLIEKADCFVIKETRLPLQWLEPGSTSFAKVQTYSLPERRAVQLVP